MRPQLPPLVKVQPYLNQMYLSGRFSNFGPLNARFEERLAEFLGVQSWQVVTCSSATTGLTGAMQLASETEFFLPNFTFAAGAHATLAAGKRIHLTDIHESNWQMVVPEKIGTSQAIQYVLPFGSPISLDQYPAVKTIVIDAAASIGAHPHDLSKLPEGWSVVFSLHATKVMGIGEGGFVVFGNQDQAREFRLWTNFGFDGDRLSAFPGSNSKLSEIAAAFGLAALDNWPEERAEWLAARELVQQKERELGLSVTKDFGNPINPYWNILLEDQATAERIISNFDAQGIETRRWWQRGLSAMPAFDNSGLGNFPMSNSISGRSIGIPFFRGISKAQVQRSSELLHASLNC